MTAHIYSGTEECYIGLPVEHSHRVARMSPAGILDDLAHLLASWDTVKMWIAMASIVTGFGQCCVYAKSTDAHRCISEVLACVTSWLILLNAPPTC